VNREHRNVLVTGASGGIGREIARVMAADGWHVLLASRNVEKLEETKRLVTDQGGTADVHRLDVADEDAVNGLAAELTASGVSVDALVNNSGIAGPSKPLWEVEPDEWNATLDVNLGGVYLCCRAFVPQMIERGTGSIVNVGSVTGKNPLLYRSPYAASKAALIGLTKVLAADAGPSGVRVNLVSPGAVGGERLDWVVASRAKATGMSEDEIRAGASKDAALKRFTEATEVAAAVRFLASDESSGITGVDLTVAAGFVMN
jgi:NAD(P)-dependent dehydrogenase (short-subunit alcohol dehydrogenase family)